MRSKRTSFPYLIWMVIFTLIPLVMIFYYAFTNGNGGFSLDGFVNAFYYKDVFLHSLWIALISTAICLVIAYPLSYIISRCKKSTQKTLIMFIMVPMWMNFLLRIYAWVLLLQNNGLIDRAVKILGLDVTLIGNTGAVILGMVYEFLPFMVIPIYNVMIKIDKSLIEASQDLGSNSFNVFRRVVFPLSVPGIISGITMVFVPTASTFLVSQYLGGTGDVMIGDIIEKIFYSDQNTGSAISLVLMITIFIFLVVMNRFGDEEAIGI